MNNHEHKHVNELSVLSYGLGVNVVKSLINSYDESLHKPTTYSQHFWPDIGVLK
jgi:hypothetical protein